MHSLLRFIISILAILALITLGSLLLPSKVTISKAILINADQAQVGSAIKDFNNWKNWYPSFDDTNVSVVARSAKPGVINSVSVKDESGRELVLDLIESKQDTVVVIIESPSSAKVNYQFILIPHGNGHTQLAWNVNTSLGWYPWEKAKGIFLDKISGPQYEAALANLKKAIEK